MARAPLVVFDLDGTLVDSVPDLAGSLDSLMADKGLEAIGIAARIPSVRLGTIEIRPVMEIGAPA